MTVQQTKVPMPKQERKAYTGYACSKCGSETVATDLSFDARFGWGPCPACKKRTIVHRV